MPKKCSFLKPFLYFRILKKQIQLNTAILEKCIQMKQNLFTWRKLEKMEITHRKKEDYPTISAYEVVFFESDMFFFNLHTPHRCSTLFVSPVPSSWCMGRRFEWLRNGFSDDLSGLDD